VKGPEWWTLSVLIKNYEPEYERIILYMMSKMDFVIEDHNYWHEVVYDVVKSAFYENVKLPESIVTFAYERSLCRNCRKKLLEYMYQKDWLTPDMEKECYFDAEKKIVEFAEKHNFKKIIIF